MMADQAPTTDENDDEPEFRVTADVSGYLAYEITIVDPHHTRDSVLAGLRDGTLDGAPHHGRDFGTITTADEGGRTYVVARWRLDYYCDDLELGSLELDD